MTNELNGLRGVEHRLLNRISDRVCSCAARTRNADLRMLAGGDLAAMLGNIREEFQHRRAIRAATLVHRAAA